MNTDEINKKIEIAFTAAHLYGQHKKFSIPDLVEATELTASDIFELFPSKKSIREYYFTSLIYQYWAMISEIEGFEEYRVSEKFSNFIYTLFDMMDEHPSFVADYYNKTVIQKGSSSDFHKETKELFKDFMTSDSEIAVSAAFLMKDLFYSLLTTQYLYLVKFWLNDESDGKERTLALVDKLTSLLEEVVYNKTVDRSFDLIKYLFGPAGIGNDIPVVGSFISDLFNDKKEETEEEVEHE